MRSLKLLLFIALCFAVNPIVPIATKAAEPTCNPTSLIEKANNLKSSGDAKKDSATLAKLADEFHAMNVLCNGYRFEGKGNKAVGAVELPAGTWLLTVTTKSFFIMKAKLLSGSCETDGSAVGDYSLINLMDGQGVEGSSIIIDSKGCKAFFTTENVFAPWVVTFEPIE